ncbi:hypothetical protein CYMTET_9849 [Cymbomonas tetramitiformis]|uniref:Uncharacterized protein n=1 Tax=Cymbomonas tetramitiformis TaxID=36881 RepID=A0AAE0GQC2_9CHLO|nr:hypothetical protein CYMTET_9849 [Cymbomonas tetramitiformis]
MVSHAMSMSEILPELFFFTADLLRGVSDDALSVSDKLAIFDDTKIMCLGLIESVHTDTEDSTTPKEGVKLAHKRVECLLAFKLLEKCSAPPKTGSQEAHLDAVLMRFAERGFELAEQFATVDAIVNGLLVCAKLRGNVIVFGNTSSHTEQRKAMTDPEKYDMKRSRFSTLAALTEWSERIQSETETEYGVYLEAKAKLPLGTRPCADSDYIFACLFSQLSALTLQNSM